MSSDLKLIFSNGYEIDYRLENTNLADKWYNLLIKYYKDPNFMIDIFQEGFEERKSLDFVHKKMKNILIEVSKFIEMPLYDINPYTQDILNCYHTLYEENADLYEKYNNNELSLLLKLNDIIHVYEGCLSKNKKDYKRIKVNFKINGIPDVTKLNFSLEDFECFDKLATVGDLYINYAQTGKHTFDTFMTGDTVDKIYDWTVFGPAFHIEFSKSSRSNENLHNKFIQWLTENNIVYTTRMGWPKTASLINDLTEILIETQNQKCTHIMI